MKRRDVLALPAAAGLALLGLHRAAASLDIQGLIDATPAGPVVLPAGTFAVPATLHLKSNVWLQGQGGNGFQYPWLGTNPSTVLKWAGPAGGDMIQLHGSGTQAIHSSGVRGLTLDATGARVALSLRSCMYGLFDDLTVLTPQFAGVEIGIPVPGVQEFAGCSQRNKFSRSALFCYTGHGFVLDGASDPYGGNTSYNTFEDLDVWHGSSGGHGFWFRNADSNRFEGTRCFAYGNYGRGFLIDSPYHGCDNDFWGVDWGLGGFEQRAMGQDNTANRIYGRLTGNGAPAPVVTGGHALVIA